jgi:hypothetical protein
VAQDELPRRLGRGLPGYQIGMVPAGAFGHRRRPPEPGTRS